MENIDMYNNHGLEVLLWYYIYISTIPNYRSENSAIR